MDEEQTQGGIDWRSSLSLLEEAYAETTIRGYTTDFRTFEAWCREHGRIALPASPETVAAYVRAATEDYAPATIRRRVTAISRIHRLCGVPDPTAAELVRLSLRRMHRLKGQRQRQPLGLRRRLLDRLLAGTADDLRGLRDRAILLVGYDTLCRRSELVALRAEDINELEGGAGSILVRRSKADPLGLGKLAFLTSRTLNAVREWAQAAQIQQGPLFRRISRAGRVSTDAMNGYSITRIVKRHATAAELEDNVVRHLSGHSFRIGAALDMVENEIDLLPIMQAGRWTSPEMVLRYTVQVDVTKSGAAQLSRLLQNIPRAPARPSG